MLASNKQFTRWHAVGALVIAMSVFMPVLVSGADTDKKSGDASPVYSRTKIESMARLTLETQRGPVFKCWQEGRLIFESNSPLVSEQKLAKAVTVRGDDDKLIQLLDLKQGLCVLTHQP